MVTTLLWLVLIIGAIPLGIALFLLPPATPPYASAVTLTSSSLLCTLAFNLTFFWQELWLVLAKAMTPGLHPVLYHNDHNWTGTAPNVELLQGVGALATLISGATFIIILARFRNSSGTWRLFMAWMAFQGLFQSLSQIAIGAVLPGNDVGRAFAFLGFHEAARAIALGAAVISMATAGRSLALHWPLRTSVAAGESNRGLIWEVSVPALIAVPLLVPFRMPRDLIEVVLVPIVVNLLGVAWTSLGAVLNRKHLSPGRLGQPGIMGPAAALLVVLAIFRLVLARGIAL